MKKVDFSGKFDAIVCLDAFLPGKVFFTGMKDLPLLAADGAALKLFDMGIIPDYVIGDLDTFLKDERAKLFDRKRVIQITDQNSNDFEKTLITASKKSFNNLLVTGFQGGELEHTLNNWSVFKKYSSKMQLCIYDCARYGIVVSSDTELNLSNGEIVSILPQPEIVLTTENLLWELKEEKLALGIREGARNRTTADKIRLYVHSGEGLVFFNDRLPFAPLFQDA